MELKILLKCHVENAINNSLKEMTFTEHMPFPAYFMDDIQFLDECAPSKEIIEKYFEDLDKVKVKFKDRIKNK